MAFGLIAAQDVTPSQQPLPENLVVVWSEDGRLLARLGSAAPVELNAAGPLLPYLSPDGQHIAYLHGTDGIPYSLSVVEIHANHTRLLVKSGDLSAGETAEVFISQLAWLDNTALVLNTARKTSFGQDHRDDLWQVDVQNGEIHMLLPPSEGGAFTISPDRKWIAVVSAGHYDHEDAQVRLLNTETDEARDIIAFPAVSTGSEYPFYPQVFWEADSQSFRAALPGKDLIYEEANGSSIVALWRFSVSGSTEQIGSVAASYFGLPRWSDDGKHLVYLRRAGAFVDNQFALFLADGNGNNPIEYAAGEAGTLGMPGWIPGSSQFMYARGEPATYWLGRVGEAAAQIPVPIFNPIILTDGQIVYASEPVGPSELRYMRIDESASVLVGRVDNPQIVFDALLALER